MKARQTVDIVVQPGLALLTQASCTLGNHDELAESQTYHHPNPRIGVSGGQERQNREMQKRNQFVQTLGASVTQPSPTHQSLGKFSELGSLPTGHIYL